MKFTVAIMNPPYDGNLHLKILEKVIPIAELIELAKEKGSKLNKNDFMSVQAFSR